MNGAGKKPRIEPDDPAGTLTPHDWEHGLDHAQDADDIGIEQRLGLADACFLDGTDQIDTGIVDQHVNATSAAEYLFNAGLDRSQITDIERHELNAGERTCRCGSANAAEDPMAPAGQQLGGYPANAGGCTRDQHNAARSVHHVNSWTSEGCGLA
jgi:hypothetical protein